MLPAFAQDINELRRGFSKIIWGTKNLKKENKICSEWKIPPNEHIMAHVKGSTLFGHPAVILTDYTLYSYMRDPIPLADLCGFIVVQEDSKAAVTLSNATEQKVILGSTLFAQNIAGIELLQLLKDLQNILYRKYNWAKKLRDNLVREIIAVAHREMRAGRISAKTSAQLRILVAEPDYMDDIAIVTAEDIFRTGDNEAYQRFVCNLSDESLVKTLLQKKQEDFEQNFLKDLGDISLVFSRDFLNQVYSNLLSQVSLSNSQCLTLAYICIRVNNKEAFCSAREQVSQRMGTSMAAKLDLFRGCYLNTQMKAVFDTIRCGKLPSSAQMDLEDSTGFNALHYAIILKQETLALTLLEKKSWRQTVVVSGGGSELYNYTVLSCLVGLESRRIIFQKTSDAVMTLLRSRRALEKRLWLMNRRLDVQKLAIQKARGLVRQAKESKAVDQEFEYREKLQVLLVRRDETLFEIDEINRLIDDVDKETRDITESAMISAASTVYRIQNSNDPLIRYLRGLVATPNLLLRTISAKLEQSCLYRYGEFFFVAAEDIKVDLPFWGADSRWHDPVHSEQKSYSQHKKTTGANEPIKKPYGDSWFSPQAHSSMKKLKEEYRTLAKKYHPDVCTHIRSQEIFQEILNERADILERMEE